MPDKKDGWCGGDLSKLPTSTKMRTLQKALDVAVIGAPNVGKSLLTNQLVRAAVSAVSSKMDTTTKVYGRKGRVR